MTKKKTTAAAFLPQAKPKLVQITPRIPADLKAQVDDLAGRLDISQNQFCESALRAYIAGLRESGLKRGAS